MQSLWHRALNKCLWSLLFHVALLFIFPKCPPSSYKPTKFLLVLPNRPWLSPPERGHSHPPSSPLAAGAPLLVPLYGSLCWIVNLRALSPQKRSWHGVGRQPVKAWKSECGGTAQWILFSWFHQMGGNGLKLMSGQLLQLIQSLRSWHGKGV